jgi:shikimate kinase
LETTLPQHQRCSLSCGGGTIIQKETRELLKSLGTVVYLQVSIEEALSRIEDVSSRPVLNGAVAPAELLRGRLPLYEDAADFKVDTNGKTPVQITEEIILILKDAGII